MSKSNKSLNKKHLSAVCGLFCPACSIYIGTKEDPQRLKQIAKRTGTKVEDWKCEGCRSKTQSYYCKNYCYMKPCAEKKGGEFCHECDEYPCEALTKFKEEAPHRIELWEAQERISKVGYLKWFEEMVEHYSCPNCGTMNSAYDITCRNCGDEPSCKYVGLHKNTINEHLSKKP